MSLDLNIETSLFYTASPAAAFRKLADALVLGFANSSIEIRPLLRAERDLVFAIGGVTLTIALTEHGLDTHQIRAANRPQCAAIPQDQALRRLNRHTAAVVIRISGPEHAAKTETRLGLAYIATMQLVNVAQPDLLHWGKSDTLYTIEEFRSSTGGHHPVRPRPSTALARRTTRSAPRQPIPAEYRGRSFVPGSGPSPTPPASRPVFSRLRSALSRGAVAGMTAPVSVGYLLQHLLPGTRLG